MVDFFNEFGTTHKHQQFQKVYFWVLA